MEVLNEIIRAGFSVRINQQNGKICFTYEGNDIDRPDTWRIKQMIKEIRENRGIAVEEIKKMESGKILSGLLPSNIRRIKIDYVGDNIDN